MPVSNFSSLALSNADELLRPQFSRLALFKFVLINSVCCSSFWFHFSFPPPSKSVCRMFYLHSLSTPCCRDGSSQLCLTCTSVLELHFALWSLYLSSFIGKAVSQLDTLCHHLIFICPVLFPFALHRQQYP